ncbi:MAG: hypothetical protein ABI811_15520 [Acidobacteriota bacterium]
MSPSLTTFQQALHVFRKDAREFRLEIAGVLILTLLLILTGVQSWESLQERGGPNSDPGEILGVLLAITWSLLIARVIQAEALPGDRHFWLTRPYSRTSLVLSKALFIAVFLNLPLMFAQAMIVSLDGLPLFSNLGGLLWNQVLITVVLFLPAAAAAVLTRNLAQFVPAAVLTVALMAGPVNEGKVSALGALEWIRSSLGLLVAAGIASAVVWRQYRRRQARTTAFLAVISAFVGIVLFLGFPHSVAFAIQSRLLGSHEGQFAVQLGPAAPQKPNSKTLNRYRQLLKLPLLITGADPQNLHMQSSVVTFKTLAGVTRRARADVEPTPQGWQILTYLDRGFFDSVKNAPVSVKAEYYLTQFGNTRSTDVPLDGTPVYVDQVGQCGTAPNWDQRILVCRSAFRQPRAFFSDRLASSITGRSLQSIVGSYSPFPAFVSVHPVFARTYHLAGEEEKELAPLAPERPVTLNVHDPVAYFRYTMDIPNVRLADYAAPEAPDDGQ